MKVIVTYEQTCRFTAQVDVNEDEYREWLKEDHPEKEGDLKEFIESGREPWYDDFPQEFVKVTDPGVPELRRAVRVPTSTPPL